MKFEIKKNEKGETDINIDLSIMPKCILWNHDQNKWEDAGSYGDPKSIIQKRYCKDCGKVSIRLENVI